MYRNDYMALVCYFLAVKKNTLFIYRSSTISIGMRNNLQTKY